MMTELVLKATVILVFGLLIVGTMRTVRASRRFMVLAWTFALLALLPAAVRFGPAIPIVVREARHVVQTPLAPASGVATGDVAANSSALPGPLRGHLPGAEPGLQQLDGRTGVDAAAALVVAIWATGVVVSLIPVLMTGYRLRTLRRTAREWNVDGRPSWEGAAVMIHEQLSTPMTFGALRPIILFPADAETWSAADVRRALAHELEHVHRRDWPVHVLARAVCAFYWFHPLAWRAWRQLHLEADRACDDAVLSCSEARAFAEQLVTLAGRIGPRVAAPALSIAGGDLTTRVNALLNPDQARGRLGAGVAVAMSVVAVTLGMTVATVQAVSMTTLQRVATPPQMSIDRVLPSPAVTSPPALQQSAPRPVQRARPASPAGAPPIKPDSPAQNPGATVAPAPDYVIGPGDLLTIVYWREKDLSADVLVRPDGKITLPLINDVDADGLTPDQLRDRITKASAKFLADPAITVGVKAINSRKVFIAGGVQKPGAYELLASMSVLQLISVAGGLREFVDGRNITIIRDEGGSQRVFKFNYQEVKYGGNLGQNISLKPGDTVVVADRPPRTSN
jgi:polysaccharide biosynthesis/export protein